jgi:hypothetical protein
MTARKKYPKEFKLGTIAISNLGRFNSEVHNP